MSTQLNIAPIINSIQSWLKEQKQDALYISSTDIFLNEYVPLENCFRFYVTGFTGSTAEVLLPAEGKVRLYVDGRYHEQADKEVDLSLVEVMKVGHGTGLSSQMLADLKSNNWQKLALQASRTPHSLTEIFAKNGQVKIVTEDLFVQFCRPEITREALPPIVALEKAHCGRSTEEKLKLLELEEETGVFVSALDNVAWLTNCRGYHLPFQSVFLGFCLVSSKQLDVFVPKNAPIPSGENLSHAVHFHSCVLEDLSSVFLKLKEERGLSKIKFSKRFLSSGHYSLLEQAFGKQNFESEDYDIYQYQNIKDEIEKEQIRASFSRSCRAIAKTVNWFKDQVEAGNPVDEISFYDKTDEFYQSEGRTGLSFNTISAIGANGSIIHFSSPSRDVLAKKGDMVLLDSGAYYEGGFATDMTRTFLASRDAASVDPKAKEIYTLTLMGLLRALKCKLPEGTPGKVIDALARGPLWERGYDFAHGTGHGVGINVHEAGINFRGDTKKGLRVGQVVSVEPGIYLPGFGGVRLENIIIVKQAETAGMVEFENLSPIGFDELLIDRSIMSQQELIWLDQLQKQAEDLGLSI